MEERRGWRGVPSGLSLQDQQEFEFYQNNQNEFAELMGPWGAGLG